MRVTSSILNQLYDFIRKSKNLGKEIVQISNMEKLAIIHQFIVVSVVNPTFTTVV